MGDKKSVENMTIKQAVEEHEKKLEKMRQQEMKKRKATAEKNMNSEPSELEKSGYTLQDEIAKQVQAVMSDGEGMADKRSAEERLNAGKNVVRNNTEINKTLQNTKNMAADARQIREQIARKRESLNTSNNNNIEVRSEVDDWLKRKQKMMMKRSANVESESNQNNGNGMPEDIENDKKLRFIWNFGEIGKWFQSLCWIHIPIIGMFYIIVIAIRKKTPPQKRNFAIAWIMYKVLVWILALTVLYILYRIGLDFVDGMLSYIK